MSWLSIGGGVQQGSMGTNTSYLGNQTAPYSPYGTQGFQWLGDQYAGDASQGGALGDMLLGGYGWGRANPTGQGATYDPTHGMINPEAQSRWNPNAWNAQPKPGDPQAQEKGVHLPSDYSADYVSTDNTPNIGGPLGGESGGGGAGAGVGNSGNDWRRLERPAFLQPTGGLVGKYQDIQNNPLNQIQQNVAGQYEDMYGNPLNENDLEAKGTADWFSSGEETAPERQIHDIYGNIAENPESNAARTLRGDYSQYGSQAMTDDDLRRAAGEGLMKTPGFTAGEQNALATSGALAAREAGDTARQRMARMEAMTGSGSNRYGNEAEVATQQGRALGEQARQNQLANIGQKRSDIAQGGGILQGLTGEQMGRTQFGLTGQGQRIDAATARQMAGLQGATGANQALRGQQEWGAGQKAQLGQNQFQRQYAGTQGLQGLGSQQFQQGAMGTAGLQNLYNQQQAQRGGSLQGMTGLAGLPTGSGMQTSGGSGSVSI